MVKLPVFQTGALRSNRSIRIKNKVSMISVFLKIVKNYISSIKLLFTYTLDIILNLVIAYKLQILHFRIANKLILDCTDLKTLAYIQWLILTGITNGPIIWLFCFVLPLTFYIFFVLIGFKVGYLLLTTYFICASIIDKYLRRGVNGIGVALYFNKKILHFLKQSSYCSKRYPGLFICNNVFLNKIFQRLIKKSKK
jgi:hypothetical protein